MAGNEMVGWQNGHEFEQTPGSDDGQGSLQPCGRKEWDTTERLN